MKNLRLRYLLNLQNADGDLHTSRCGIACPMGGCGAPDTAARGVNAPPAPADLEHRIHLVSRRIRSSVRVNMADHFRRISASQFKHLGES